MPIASVNSFARATASRSPPKATSTPTQSLPKQSADCLPHGRAGFIVPIGIATERPRRWLSLRDLMRKQSIACSSDLRMRTSFSAEVHNEFKFCCLTVRGDALDKSPADFSFFTRRFNQIQDKRRHFYLTPNDLMLLNPNTRTCPVFRTGVDASLTQKLYEHLPLTRERRNRRRALEHPLYDDVPHGKRQPPFRTTSQPAGSASTDEAKMIHQFDHRFASLIGKLSAGYKVEAMERASRGESYVVTSGTGSGKSLTYFLPIIDAFLASTRPPPDIGTTSSPYRRPSAACLASMMKATPA